MALRFAQADPARPPASELIEAMVSEISGLYGGRLDAPGLPRAAPGDLVAEAGGACLVGRLDGEAVAVGAVKRLGDGLGEIKRMYVAPAARSRGVGRALLAELEAAALALGHRRVRLDTGPSQPHARALYEHAGYVEVPDYNGNPHAAWWGEKVLAP